MGLVHAALGAELLGFLKQIGPWVNWDLRESQLSFSYQFLCIWSDFCWSKFLVRSPFFFKKSILRDLKENRSLYSVQICYWRSEGLESKSSIASLFPSGCPPKMTQYFHDQVQLNVNLRPFFLKYLGHGWSWRNEWVFFESFILNFFRTEGLAVPLSTFANLLVAIYCEKGGSLIEVQKFMTSHETSNPSHPVGFSKKSHPVGLGIPTLPRAHTGDHADATDLKIDDSKTGTWYLGAAKGGELPPNDGDGVATGTPGPWRQLMEVLTNDLPQLKGGKVNVLMDLSMYR